MAVATYIQDLLYRYECVILPGFGALITRQNPARLNSDTHEFFPPKKTVSFNSQLSHNDGLLASYIATVEGVSFEKAVQIIDAYVKDIRNILAEKAVVNLDKIGTFQQLEDEKIIFEPAGQTNYLKESFGLSPFFKDVVLRSESHQIVLPGQEADSSFKRPSNWMKYAAVGILCVGLSGAVGANFYQKKINEHNIAEQKEALSILEDQIQEATFVIDNPLPAITFKVSKQSGNFHVVAGAFRSEENAESKVQELKKQGFKARSLKPNRFGLHQVLYSSHETRRDAINALNAVKRTSNPGAWLLVQEM